MFPMNVCPAHWIVRFLVARKLSPISSKGLKSCRFEDDVYSLLALRAINISNNNEKEILIEGN